MNLPESSTSSASSRSEMLADLVMQSGTGPPEIQPLLCGTEVNKAFMSGKFVKKEDETTAERLKDMKIAKASKQYVFDEEGNKYLDCFNGVAHVGHCHPQVVSAATSQMSRVATSQGFKSDQLGKYVSRLAQTLPDELDVVYMCNSGSEANDLALRLARQFTNCEDVVVTEDAFHGNLGVLIDISPKMHQYVPNYKPKDFVHVSPLPSSYRLSDILSDLETPSDLSGEKLDQWIAAKCAEKVEAIFVEAKKKGRGIAGFICEPCFIVSGVHMPHPSYFERVYKICRENGALFIADETQTGLGRTGDHYWGFQNYRGFIPDIVTCGRPLGSGHPIGAAVTSERVSKKLGAYFSTFGGNPVSCAIGLTVLDVIKNESLMSSAKSVGRVMFQSLNDLKGRYPDWIGDIRGHGLVVGIEIVTDGETRAPNSPLAVNVMYSLKADEKTLVGISGKHRNVLFISPPMCFNMENCRRLINSIENVLAKVKFQIEFSPEELGNSTMEGLLRGCIAGPVKNFNRQKREHNAHLFAVESPVHDGDSDDIDYTQQISEDQWTTDAKKAKLELEDYEDVD